LNGNTEIAWAIAKIFGIGHTLVNKMALSGSNFEYKKMTVNLLSQIGKHIITKTTY
jgi:ribosomal protein S13